MRLQFLRNRGLSPASLKRRALARLKEKKISHRRVRRFQQEMAARGLTGLPLEAPQTIAVVVPCYKHATYLPEMLQSIAAQTRAPDEVIFVDDCSPDATGETLRNFIATHPWPAGTHGTLLVNERNMGQSASLNRAIEAASSQLVMILNDDDYLMHDAVESMLGYFRDYREVALVGAEHISFAGRETLAAAQKVSTAHSDAVPLVIRRPEDVARYRFANDLSLTHSGHCFLKTAWHDVGGYWSDKRRRVVPFSDRDFQLRINAVFPVGLAQKRPLAFWRNDSSVDGRLNS